ncbi:MAG: ABC transporter permease [Oscillospiraceae bacterium]|jgi:multidrug/hemolysin transport system permease protein|nr:ABC transporter permease [Oscillospiraceae bacterium]
MGNVAVFTRRNIVLFLRDKATVFFSFLSTIILIALYFLFIGKSYADGVADILGNYISMDNIYALVYIQMMVGVLVLNSLSLSIGAFSTIAKDFETRRVDSFLITPAKPGGLLLSYFFGGFAVSFVLNLFTWILSIVLIGLLYGYWVSLSAAVIVALVLVFASAVSCAITLLITAIVKTSAAIGVFSGVAGTFFGFICGIYMPYETLGSGMVIAGSVLPFTHIAIWLKQIVLKDAFAVLSTPKEFQSSLLSSFSANNIGLAGVDLSQWLTLAYTGVFALLCLLIAWWMIGRKLYLRNK